MSHRRTFKSYDPFNKHEYVDLGLPSGTLWSPFNVGANTILSAGYFIQWGAPYEANSNSWYTDGPYYDTQITGFTKYNTTDNLIVLQEEDDAAAVLFGGEWKTPSQAQYNELISNTTNAKVEKYNGANVTGYTYTSIINGNTIFFPTNQGYKRNASGASGSSDRTMAYYWTSNLYTYNKSSVYCFEPRGHRTNFSEPRYYGLNVKPCINLN